MDATSERVLRVPPRIKVLEAAGAIADGRVRVEARVRRATVARVSSSTGEREYLVIVKPGNGGGVVRVYSDDNGTRYRGYTGYPIIAVMMLEGLLPRDPRVEEALRGVRWKELNERYKKYSVVEEIVLRRAEERGVTRGEVQEYVRRVMSLLRGMRVIYDPGLLVRVEAGRGRVGA